ncbi:MAG: tRNA (adenosine(37)-N6)-threonylcarbamoyltransferase complex ATPase subunit type 1 TsaE [Bacteroidota bacterium]|nr:tRNA (adenosine(37)-N6)-threonylcarbamoyltransferase complex ATPase subunit type 1 TsaE [Bacteroidota bacterium]MDP4231992.1 tRNA (adenosine(37)-N6)-threonylcarbamoyltransferase complex ATPase subunit type 1 TsaE [Bacteroidota bacterium]MDP4241301.1 tRNA (adenosine(37)-N6)-threonylcarbamoyltransferase complex ATPase subunit type 1 TsaE [Bacteroidota bacterium]
MSKSPEDTLALGEAFGREFVRAGVVVTVRGELGAGKTHFIKGIARSLGIDERDITSPTFTLANEFEVSAAGNAQTESLPRRAPRVLFHLDCYRFEKPEELLALGVEDYLYPKNAATIIEWPERIAGLIPADAMNVTIEIIGDTERNIAW